MTRNTQPGHVSTATHSGPKPGDFPLASVESRAAARARVQRLAEEDGPRKGDVLLQLTATDWPDRHKQILQVLQGRGRLQSRPERIGRIPLIWLALPESFRFETLFGIETLPEIPPNNLLALPISLTDLPYFKELLTAEEMARLCGHSDGESKHRRVPPNVAPEVNKKGTGY